MLLAPVAGLVAQTGNVYGVSKRENFLQTSAATPVAHAIAGDPDGMIFHLDFEVTGTGLNMFSTIKLTLPNMTQLTAVDKENLDNTKYGFPDMVTHGFADKSALDTAFANGTYNVTIGSTVVPFTLTPDSYPAVIPTITGGTWDAQGHLLINANSGATVNFNTFSNYIGNGFISGTVFGGLDASTGELVSQTSLNITGLYTDPLATSFTIPPHVLLPGHIYYSELSFGRLTAHDAITLGVGVFGHADYDYLTGMMIKAIGAAADFNADGKTDVLWRNTSTGTVASWTSGGAYTVFGTESGNWAAIAIGDFDGDGKADVLWHNTATGLVASWTSGGGFKTFGTEDVNWTVVGKGDFDGDGKTDVLWRNSSTGIVASWTSGAGYTVFGQESGGWAMINTGDFDGDGKADVLWHNTMTGLVASWTSGAGYKVFGSEGGNWAVINAGDFDGDGKADVLWHNTSTGLVASWTSGAGYTVFGTEDSNWKVLGRGDYDGDGKVDVLWHNLINGLVASWTSGGGYTVFGTEGGNWAATSY